MKAVGVIFRAIICVAIASPSANTWSEESGPKRFCENPKPNAPSLSFTLTSFHPGDFTRNCATWIERAKSMGFTSVAICPAYAYDPRKNTFNPESETLLPGELGKCLDLALGAGLDITYQPHLDSARTLNGNGEADWRAEFKVIPDAKYKKAIFGEFDAWLKKNANAISARKTQVDVMISSELEVSNMEFGKDWQKFTQDYKAELTAMNMRSADGVFVRLGLNPNYYPKWNPTSDAEMSQFVREVDYIAPSFYGDLSDVDNKNQIGDHKLKVQNSLAKGVMLGGLLYRGRDVPEVLTKDFAIGEFGIGSSLTATEIESEVDKFMVPGFIDKRRRIYDNLLAWAKAEEANPKTDNRPYSINIWSTGDWDPVGISNAVTMRDSEISEKIRKYTQWRCPGINFPPVPQLPPDEVMRSNYGDASKCFPEGKNSAIGSTVGMILGMKQMMVGVSKASEKTAVEEESQMYQLKEIEMQNLVNTLKSLGSAPKAHEDLILEADEEKLEKAVKLLYGEQEGSTK